MKKFASIASIASIACLVAAASFISAAVAGGGGSCHFHGNAPAKEAVVADCASEQMGALIRNGKIDASWKSIKLDKSETVEGKGRKEWKLSFKNTAEKDVSKQTLYMFYTLSGNFIGANFTGN